MTSTKRRICQGLLVICLMAQAALASAANETRVAEPSTLLLVSFGVFGLIAWSRRRR
jgi:hypothetical protein